MDSETIGKTKEEETGGQMTFFEHLIELRKRIINSLIAIAVCAAGGWFLAPKVVNLIAKPIQVALTKYHYDAKLYYTGPTDYLGLLIKLSIYIGLVVASPVVLYQVWMFVAPALYKHERSAVTGFVFSTVVLFVGGIAFGYFLALPHILGFLMGFQGPTAPVAPLIRINDYFDLVLLVLVALGLVFELPVLIFLLCYFGIVTPRFLVQNTKYAILAITIVAAIVTPTPDALTMLLVMGVMLALYFLGVGVAWVALRNRAKQAAATAAQGA